MIPASMTMPMPTARPRCAKSLVAIRMRVESGRAIFMDLKTSMNCGTILVMEKMTTPTPMTRTMTG